MALDPLSISSASSTAALDAIATVITVRFGYDWSAGDYTGSVTYSAPEQIKTFGTIEKVIEAPFCATARQASRIAEYWCQRLSVPQYTATIETDRSNAGVCVSGRVSLIHPHLPGGSTTDALVIANEYNPDTGDVTISALLPSTILPAVQLSGYSGRFTQAAPTGTTVKVGNGTIDLVVADDKGNVLSGATAILDGAASTTADASGRVVFKNVSSGVHSVEIRATGYEAFTMSVTV